MLPLTEDWYRRQLLAAVLLGVFGGLFALVFSVATTWAIDGLFGDAASDPWSGEWWWIGLTAGGAVLVTAMRKALTVPDEVPGAIAMCKAARVDPALAPKLVIISVVSLVFLGIFAALTLLVHASVGLVVRRVVARVKIPWVTAAVGGGLIGLIAFALPLTADGGSNQLGYTAENFDTLGIGLLIAVLLGKMVAMNLSQEVGFLGGSV